MPRRDLRAEILHAAERLAVERGFNSVTTREVAQEAGCSEGSIYNHFRDRTDLLAHVVAARMQASTAKVAEACSPVVDGVLPPLAAVLAVAAQAYLELIALSASLVADPVVRARFDAVMTETGASPNGMRDALAARIAAGQARGEIRSDVDAEEVAALIIAACHQEALHAFVAGARAPDAHRSADQLSPLMDVLLQPPSAPKRRRGLR